MIEYDILDYMKEIKRLKYYGLQLNIKREEKQMKKKFIATILVGTLVVGALSGCGNSTQETVVTTAQTEETTTVTADTETEDTAKAE